MTTWSDKDEALWNAMESGQLEPSLAGDVQLAKAFRAHQELESLFALLRRPPETPVEAEHTVDHPTAIGRYLVRRLLGRGAFGVVYTADDPELDRAVAIKVPRPQRFSSEAAAERFLEEAKLAAQLKHPGIVTVHDVGRDGHLCYIVMEYVQGQSLQELIAAKSYSPDESAELVAQVADALHYAHKKGFVHRDLKPANILIDDQGHPHITDFGLAVSEDSQRQYAGQVAGTPAYMSPQQVRGETQYLDGRTDIWSAGVILYQLLTGRLPFWTESAQEYRDQVEHREPKPPRQIDDGIPGELERITLKCLAKQTTERYSTAADLAASLRRGISTRRYGLDSNPTHALFRLGSRPFRWAMAGAILVALGVWAAIAIQSRNTASSSPLTGSVNVRIWNPEKPGRRDLSLVDAGALPLIAGDHIRVEASVSRPSYLYVVWITADGEAFPVHPWIQGDWTHRPKREHPVSSLSLPEGITTGWPMQGPTGMETLVLMGSETPISADIDLAKFFVGFPKQNIQDPRAIVWLDNGEIVNTRERAPQFFNPKEIDDPMLTTQRLMAERLEPYCQLIQAVSFANAVPTGE